MRAAVRWRPAIACIGVLLSTSCGARTELASTLEPCPEGAETRSCRDACGAGEQRCTEGFWQACEVPQVSRTCSNVCGSGVQACTSGVWAACEVAIATRVCSDACGSGVESCSDGAWRACRVPEVRLACESVCGPGEEICSAGDWTACNAPQPSPPRLISVIRDFDDTHPDFELPIVGQLFERGLVNSELGPDDKPVYAHKANSLSTSGQSAFDQWYRDTPGVNQSTSIDLTLRASAESPGMFVYDDPEFFPIDGQLLGNQGRAHNFHFTLEASTRFQYLGGEVFRFSGDDDMWVFINRRLAIDLGGTHSSLAASVSLDEAAERLGLVRGGMFPLHFFFAERHTSESHFKIETSISEPGSCD